jgi:hypothetical protein
VGGAIGAFVRSVGVVLAGCYGRCDHGIRAVAAATAPRCDSKAGAVGVAALSGRLETCAVCFEVGVAVSEAMVVVIGDWSRGRNGCCDQRLEPWAGQSELSKGQSGPLACKWRRVCGVSGLWPRTVSNAGGLHGGCGMARQLTVAVWWPRLSFLLASTSNKGCKNCYTIR